MKKVVKFITIIGFFITLLLLYYAFKDGLFNNPKDFQLFISSLGIWGIVVFICLQAIQPIISITPGGVGTIAGVIMYGNILGVFYSCIGLIIGEIISFLLVRKYGMTILEYLLSKKSIQNLEKIISYGNNHIQRIIIFIFCIPFGPDDLVCYAAGLSNISLKKYVLTISIFKPISVIVYCYLVINFMHKM